MASGIKSAIKILVGNDEAVTAVDCYVDDTDFTPLLQGFIDGVGPDDEGIIFTDLLDGSVCNKIMTLMGERSLPFALDEVADGFRQGDVAVVPLAGGSPLSAFLRDLGEPCAARTCSRR